MSGTGSIDGHVRQMIETRTSAYVGPDFLCIGAQKAGTTWLYEQLAVHPAAWMLLYKELHYFNGSFRQRMKSAMKDGGKPRHRPLDDRDRVFLEHAVTYVDDTIDFAWYRELFASKGDRISGDITPLYSTLSSDMVAAINRELPGVKIVFLVRDPIQRLWSQLAMIIRRRRRHSDHSLDDVQDDLQALRKVIVSAPFLDCSFPALTTRTWRQHFGRERLFIGFFDDLQERPAWLRARIFEFVGIAPDDATVQLAVDHNPNPTVWKPEMTTAIRETLVDHFRDELHRCADELGGPACNWPGRYGL
jgi:hypothetical protein